MTKLKDMWLNNKILVVLVSILTLCFILICFVFITYFFGGSKSSYGPRLENLNDHKITSTVKNTYLEEIESDKIVESTKFSQKGKILYIKINFIEDITIDEAKSVAVASLQNLEEYLDYYDINFTIASKDSENTEGFLLMGSKNINGKVVVWNNNTIVKESN